MSEEVRRVQIECEEDTHMVKTGTEGVRGSSQGLRESDGLVKGLARQKVLSGSVGVRGPSQDLRDSEVSVRV